MDKFDTLLHYLSELMGNCLQKNHLICLHFSWIFILLWVFPYFRLWFGYSCNIWVSPYFEITVHWTVKFITVIILVIHITVGMCIESFGHSLSQLMVWVKPSLLAKVIFPYLQW